MTFRFEEEITARFEDDLNRARGYRPVTQKEMKQAYKQYEKVGHKFGTVKKKHTDEQLYKKATDIVIKWWKFSQKEKAEKKAKQKQAEREARERARQGGGASGGGTWVGSGGGGNGYSGTGSGSYGMPDTALGSGGAGSNLPDILTPSEKEQRSSASNADAQRREQREMRRMALNASEVALLKRELGVPSHWTPPPNARRSEREFKAWAARTAQKRDYILRRRQEGYFNNDYVARVARRYGVRIDPSRVPVSSRNTPEELVKYMVAQKKLIQAQQTMQREGVSTYTPPAARVVDPPPSWTGRGGVSEF